MSNEYPHGKCECNNGCECEQDPGPAAYSVTRFGKFLLVCTCCVHKVDRNLICLVSRKDDASIYYTYDTLGAFILSQNLRDDGANQDMN